MSTGVISSLFGLFASYRSRFVVSCSDLSRSFEIYTLYIYINGTGFDNRVLPYFSNLTSVWILPICSRHTGTRVLSRLLRKRLGRPFLQKSDMNSSNVRDVFVLVSYGRAPAHVQFSTYSQSYTVTVTGDVRAVQISNSRIPIKTAVVVARQPCTDKPGVCPVLKS